MRLPKALNSSGRAFHRVGAAAKNAPSPVVLLVLLGKTKASLWKTMTRKPLG